MRTSAWVAQICAMVKLRIWIKYEEKKETARVISAPVILFSLLALVSNVPTDTTASEFPATGAGHSSLADIFLPLYLPLGFSFFARHLILNIVTEKGGKVKQNMLVMGLQPSAYWCGLFCSEAIIAVIICVFAVLAAGQGNLFHGAVSSFVFALLFLFALCSISFAFLMSSICTDPKIAAQVGGVCFLASVGAFVLFYNVIAFQMIYIDGFCGLNLRRRCTFLCPCFMHRKHSNAFCAC
jgi:hypothetical protein